MRSDPRPGSGGPSWIRHLPDGRTRLLGILGDPLVHSLSPRLHSAVLRRLDRNLIYVPFPVSAARLPAFLRYAGAFGVLGLNVTTPFKERVARLVRPLDRETIRTGAVNTIVYRDGAPWGTGTDGAGVLAWRRALALEGEPFGVLGSGASARSLIDRSIAEGAGLPVVVSRRPRKVIARLSAWGAREVVVLGWNEFPWGGVDRRGSPPRLWVSTLPPSASPLPEPFWKSLSPDSVLLDLNYGEGRTQIADEARQRGFRAAGGLGPLCHQAALSLSLWLEEEVPVRLFFEALGRSERSLRPRR